VSKFTLETLAKFIQDAADGGIMQRRRPAKEIHMETHWNGFPPNVWETVDYTPRLDCDTDNWKIVEPPKPLKIINMSALIKSGIDCVFDNGTLISQLKAIRSSGTYTTYYSSAFEKRQDYHDCLPRMNHKHVLNNRACPLPEGFIVRVWYREGHAPIEGHCLDMAWDVWYFIHGFVVFEVLGVADGYVLPFEVKNANNT
jgi:hypothetical protein